MVSALFSPLSIRSLNFKNRIAVSPMCQYSSQDGFANDWHLVHLGSRAVGGAAIIFTEATAISAEGRISPGDLGIWKEDHIEFLNRITNFIYQQGSIAAIQLAHAGRKASTSVPWLGGKTIRLEEGGWTPVAPSALSFNEGYVLPKELSVEGIQKVVNDFRTATTRSLQAGFKIIEIHAAHGYLIHEFLSPLSNQRTDHYGGSFENRIRLLSEIIRTVRQVWPAELALFVRISATDYKESGWTVEDSIRLSQVIHELGVDLIDCSSGGNVSDVKIPVGPGYQVNFAQRIKKEVGILTGAVGLITEIQQAEEIISSGKADIVLLGREMLRQPYFALNANEEANYGQAWPVQYERAKIKK